MVPRGVREDALQSPKLVHFSRLFLIRHNKQLHGRRYHTLVFGRSLFGLVRVYNLLPQSVVDATSVQSFQRVLQKGLLRAASTGVVRWQYLFSPVAAASPLTGSDFQNVLYIV